MLRVLTFHRIAEPDMSPDLHPGLISATPDTFERLAVCLAMSYRVVSMEEVLDSRRSGRPLPRRSVLLTFDDAYRDFAEVAWPVLARHGLPATLFVATAYAEEAPREFWWDRLHRALAHTPIGRLSTPIGPLACATPEEARWSLRRIQQLVKSMDHDAAMALVDDLCRQLECPPPSGRATLDWSELRALADAGVVLAPHSRLHALLTRVPPDRARAEIVASREDLAREIARPCLSAFAYPSGAYDRATVGLLAGEGFELGFTTRGGHNEEPLASPLSLCRTNVTPRTTELLLRMRLTPLAGRLEQWRTAGEGGGRWRGPTRAPAAPDGPAPVAYVMSRFPKISETFVLNEILAVERSGVQVEVFPLLRARQSVTHPEAAALVGRARFAPLLSMAILRANVRTLVRQPLRYVSTWRDVLRSTWGSANFFVGAVGILPKAVWMASEAQRLGVRHVHAHFANHPAVAAYVVGRLTGIPFSFTAHGSDLHVERRMLPEKVAAAAFVVAISHFNRDMILRECGGRHAEKVHVVHCGVDLGRFGQPAKAASGAGPLAIVCVASLEPVKGHQYLLAACDLLRRRGVRFTCHLIGDGPLRRRIARRIAELSLGERVVVHGPCTGQQVAGLLRRCDVAVLASAPTPGGKREGIPVALMEAMATGLPVVSTTTGGIPELVRPGTNGMLVPPRDAEALADALVRLSGDLALRARLGRGGRETIAREFDERWTSAAMVALFGGVPVRGRPGPESTSKPLLPDAPGVPVEDRHTA
jgi:glycosyltransferase involved in cell wall biosynthesis/peptidoglycan/xylan/chitin deacetylase (PgdA/CDA1 family)